MRLPSTAQKSPQFRYLAFNKPFNVLSQFTAGSSEARDAEPRRTLADFIALPDVYPVGRLDYDSEGLMLLTSDGVFQHRLTDPRFSHPRTYWVQVEGIVTETAIRALSEGVPVQSYRAKAVNALSMDEPHLPPRQPAIRFRAKIPTSWLELSIAEGRNRQVRRMTAAVGFPTLRLVRVSVGSVCLGTLQPGSWRDLTDSEMRALQRAQT